MSKIFSRIPAWQEMMTQDLIKEIDGAHAYKRSIILTELCFRLNSDPDLFSFIKEQIVDKSNREEVFFGFIKVSWIPVMFILELNRPDLIDEVKSLVKLNWNKDEIEGLQHYVKKSFDISSW